MFIYSDPTGDSSADDNEALKLYRTRVHAQYSRCASHRKSAFTHLHAFEDVQSASVDHVTWPAFPRISSAISLVEIDRRRSELQDEYCEWATEREGEVLTRVTFTTEFHELYFIHARRGVASAIAAVKSVYPDAKPSGHELFGIEDAKVDRLSEDERETTLSEQLPKNPWNNGRSGILFLTQQSNNMFALFELANDCATPDASVAASEVCANSSCAVGRNSDPAVCQALQLIARADRSLAIIDPPGVTIRKLGGVWELDGRQFDINGPGGEHIWKVSRNHHRGVLAVPKGLTLAGAPITSGAQVAKALQVGVSVISAPDAKLPIWARRGNESTRRV